MPADHAPEQGERDEQEGRSLPCGCRLDGDYVVSRCPEAERLIPSAPGTDEEAWRPYRDHFRTGEAADLIAAARAEGRRAGLLAAAERFAALVPTYEMERDRQIIKYIAAELRRMAEEPAP